MRQHRTSACLMYHDCWTFREALFGGRTRFRRDLVHGSATGLFGFVATTVRRERGVMASTGCRSIMVRRSTVRRDYGAPGLRHTGVHDCLGVCGAPGLRCTGSTVHWDPRLPWRLWCAGTSVRRDFGAPGLRCAGTSVHRGDKFSGEHPRAPRFPAQVGTTCGARRPGSSDRASRSCRVSRQNPPRAPSSAGPGSGGNHPCPSPAALREQLRGYQRRTQRLALSGPEYFC